MTDAAATPLNVLSDPTADGDVSSGAEATGRSRRGERVPLLSDEPLRDPSLDRFGFVAFANALALIVDHERTATPLTIAVSAPWGGGKSSVGGMVDALLADRVARRRGDDPRVVCWFNAWEHEDAAHLGAALAAAVAREANRRRPWWRRALSPLPGVMLGASERARRTWIIAAVSLAIAAMLALTPGGKEIAHGLLGTSSLPTRGLGALGATAVAILIFQRVFATAKSAARFIDDPRSEASRGSMSEVKHQLGTLIRDATRNGRLVIIVDDLDRCESGRALEVCRVASQLLAQEGVVTILLADMSPIAASAAARFSVGGDDGNADQAIERADDVGRRYLEKIAQLELMLPPPAPADMREVGSTYGAALRQPSPSAKVEATRASRLRTALLSRRPRLHHNDRRVKRPLDATQSQRRLLRGVQRVGFWPVAASFALVVFDGLIQGVIHRGADYSLSGPILVLYLVLFLAGAVIAPWSIVLRLLARGRRNRLKQCVEDVKRNTDLSPEEVANEVISKTKAKVKTPPARLDAERELVSDLVSSSFLDSDEFQAVERYLGEHPSRLPREGKRTFNHAQLLTEIARARRMFGGSPTLGPEHLAKWVALRERWPAIGRAVLRDPDVLARLEEAAAAGQLETALHAETLHLTDMTALIELLKALPSLAEVIERLVYFKPAEATPNISIAAIDHQP